MDKKNIATEAAIRPSSSDATGWTRKQPARDAFLLLILMVLGTGLRLHMLGANSLWLDEAASVAYTSMNWSRFLKVLWGYQANMALYYLLLRAWLHLGDSEVLVRGLSVMLGVATIPALYLLATRLFGRMTGLLSASLLAVHAFHIRYSQVARAYTLLPLLLVISTYLLVCAVESPHRKRYWAAYVIAAALSVYTHLFAVLVLAAHAMALVLGKPYKAWRTLVPAGAVFALLVAPMALFVALHHSQLDSIPPPTARALFRTLELLTGEGGVTLLFIYFGLAVLAFAAPAKSRSREESWALRLAGLWLILPPIAILSISLIKPILVSRFLLMCVPPLLMLASHGIVKVAAMSQKRWIPTVAMILLLTLSLWGTQRYFNEVPYADDWRAAVDYIVQRARARDGTVIYIPNPYAYRYYAHHSQLATLAPDILYPGEKWQPISHELIQRAIAGRDRVWLILNGVSERSQVEPELIESTLGERFRPVSKQVFPLGEPITIVLYVRASAP